MGKAKEIEITISLFALDAVCLATAIISHANLVTEDKLLLEREVVKYAQKEGVRITGPKEEDWCYFYRDSSSRTCKRIAG